MKKVFRCPIHNLIAFDKKEEAVIIDLINTKEMQRLRRIRQLGLSSVTYPGTDHSRFAHSLGVAFLAQKLVDSLKHISDDPDVKQLYDELHYDKLLLMVTALLHDVGHGPFSHAIERFTGKGHEKWGCEIIGNTNTEINKVLISKNINVERVKNILLRTEQSILVKTVSSQLDVDRFDYLLRDSHAAGVEYGKYDLEWILHSLRIAKVGDETEIVVDISKGKHALEGYVLARYWMYTQVYYHKTTHGMELLLERILRRASEVGDGIFFDEAVNRLLREETSIDDFLQLDEPTIIYHIKRWAAQKKDGLLADICNRFLNRKLFKSTEFSFGQDSMPLYVKFHQAASELLQKKGYDPNFYLLQYEAKNIAYKEDYFLKKSKGGDDEATSQIYVIDKKKNVKDLSDPDVSVLISELRNRAELLNRLYFPAELGDDVLDLRNNMET